MMRVLQGARWLSMVAVFCLVVFSSECVWSQSFTCTLKKIEKKGEGWTFKYTYPVLSTSDALMGTTVRDFNDRIKKEVEREEKTALEILKKSPKPAMHEVGCTIVDKTPRYASFFYYRFNTNMKQANSDIKINTINWTTDGKYLTLDDICIPGERSLEKLSSLSEKFLKEKLADKGLNPMSEGWAPKAENFQNVCLTSKGLKIYFRYYQVGSRPLGAPDIMIPWSSIEEVLTPEAKELLKH